MVCEETYDVNSFVKDILITAIKKENTLEITEIQINDNFYILFISIIINGAVPQRATCRTKTISKR